MLLRKIHWIFSRSYPYVSDRIKWRFTPPCGGATQPPGTGPAGGRISIHAPRVGGDIVHLASTVAHDISIHAPRVGGDGFLHGNFCGEDISIHAPRVGGDPVQLL